MNLGFSNAKNIFLDDFKDSKKDEKQARNSITVITTTR